ncbi:hypothetical protein BRD56_04930 [Thermoplasmatales archaeon SW_10_69_26]|nr:MAG: hypothetical protein BRD56_04930 [Thermoplasmatales archaeon SW_10_69_26]
MSAWLWLAGLALLLVLLAALALSSPIEVEAYAAYPAQPPVQVDVRWLYGVVNLEGLGPSAEEEPEAHPEPEPKPPAESAQPAPERQAPPEPEPGPAPEAETRPEAEERGPEPGPEDEDESRLESALDQGVEYLETRKDVESKVQRALAVLRTEDLPLAVTRMLRDLVHAVHVERIGVQAGFGFGSPAQTGKVFGQLTAAFAWTHATDKIHVDLQPDFHAVGFEAGADAHVHARTWKLLRPLIVFALAPPVWQAIRNARGGSDG